MKNLVVLAPLIFARLLFDLPSVVAAVEAFVLFCLLSGAVYLVVTLGTGIIQSRSPAGVFSDTNLLLESVRGAGWCLVAGYLVAGSLPFIESAFGPKHWRRWRSIRTIRSRRWCWNSASFPN